MSIDCTDYTNCPKEIIYEEKIPDNVFTFLFVGCWGVYCKKGKHKVAKYKDKEWSYKDVIYGQGYVVPMMIEYSQINRINAVVLAGDNVYSDIPDENLKSIIEQDETKKTSLYNIDKQLSKGFEDCMAGINTDQFLLGIGNHDIENCYILNKQLNYPNWNMPGLSYNILYRLNTYNINMIFIDTNMYEKKWCQGVYPNYAISEQDKWLGHILQVSPKNTWNIVIGHIPFWANPHKGKERVEIKLLELIQKYSNLIDLYMCADEHNQQYITLPNLPPQVISGTGGAVLDNISISENLKNYTHVCRSEFGFVSVNVSNSQINLDFYTVNNINPIQHVIIGRFE